MLDALGRRLRSRDEQRLIGIDLIAAAISVANPIAGGLIAVVDRSLQRAERAALRGDLACLQAEVRGQQTHFERRMGEMARRAAQEAIAKVLMDLRDPAPRHLDSAFRELQGLQLAGFTTPLFEGLLQGGPYYQRLLEHPRQFGRVLRSDERLAEGCVPFFIELDGEQRILEISSFSLQQLIERSVQGEALQIEDSVIAFSSGLEAPPQPEPETRSSDGFLGRLRSLFLIDGRAPGSLRRVGFEGHDGFELAFVPSGSFMMGSPANDELAREDERPRTRIRLSHEMEFGIHPVTQGLYEAVTGENPSSFKGRPDSPSRPVEKVSWHDAIRFCNALSERCGLPPAYEIEGSNISCVAEGGGFRLPMESEWEYAARAGQRLRFAGSDDADEVAWHQGNSGRQTWPVGQKAANAWGLYDMSGNVAEWCWDWMGSYEDRSPNGPKSGSRCVLRGGSWFASSERARVAARGSGNPRKAMNMSGFRVVRNVTEG